MFGFFKLSGAPPRAFQYYRSTKDADEKTILEDLYKAYNQFIKDEEAEVKRLQKMLSANGVRSYDDYNYQKTVILSSAFDSLVKYGENKGYSEFLISLFHQG
ncbi:hypothetical protein RAC89_19190 [Paenibacillus sp. GD4]|uniref:hypothetical protein n=1 Tax=Paenibacillus sp. GD4 TaxID=3068890 RepID=UPI002796BDEC|nr:hypothetical protein [Paenibacillus sp. GD4]MDQ1912522.1 hypothetical protein [Paenibacillus sp. GD4]